MKEIKGIRVPSPDIDTIRNYAYFPIFVEEEYGINRDELYKKFTSDNIYPRKYFYPLTADQACFKNQYRKANLRVARRLSSQVMVLPLYEEIKQEQVEKIIAIIGN